MFKSIVILGIGDRAGEEERWVGVTRRMRRARRERVLEYLVLG